MRLAINHEKYTHIDVRGYRERKDGCTRYIAVVVPVTVDGICVRSEAFTGYRVSLNSCNRASRSAENHARVIAAILIPQAIAAIASENGFYEPDFDSSLLTFTAC